MSAEEGRLNMQRPLHAELREQSNEPLLKSAVWLGVSIGHLHNCEHGLAQLTAEQDASLCTYYLARIAERMERLTVSLATNYGIHDALKSSSSDGEPSTSPDA